MSEPACETIDLFFEIRTEDLPPLLETLFYISHLRKSLDRQLGKCGCKLLEPEPPDSFKRFLCTPSRLAIYTSVSLSGRVKRGPALADAYRNGKPTRVLRGFLRSQNAKIRDLLNPVAYKGKEYIAVKPRLDLAKKIGKIIGDALSGMELPRQMRWTSAKGESYRFVRRITGATIFLDHKFIGTRVFGVNTTQEIGGHRFYVSNESRLLPETATWEQYLAKLENLGVMRSMSIGEEKTARADVIRKEAKKYGYDSTYRVGKPEESVAQTCEYPEPIHCTFDEKYLKLPQAVIEEVGLKHLKVFTAQEGSKKKPNEFLFIADRKEPSQELKRRIRKGVEAVMAARLEDALFLYEQDLKLKEKDLWKRLEGMSYVNGLGLMPARCNRIEKIADYILPFMGLEEDKVSEVKSAARLCKIDLGTQLVGELPALEGKVAKNILPLSTTTANLIGSHLDRRKDEIYPLWYLIFSPKILPGDHLQRLRACLVLSHELERLVANVAVRNLRTRGSGDRAGIRRSVGRVANSLFNYAIDSKKEADEVDLVRLVGVAAKIVREDVEESFAAKVNLDDRFAEAVEYLTLQIRSAMVEKFAAAGEHLMKENELGSNGSHVLELLKKYLHQIFQSGETPTSEGSLFVSSCYFRASSLFRFAKSEPNRFLELNDAIKRLANISAKSNIQAAVDKSSLGVVEEKNLHSACLLLSEIYEGYREKLEFEKILRASHAQIHVVNNFFDKVMVNDPDEKIRNNRLALVKFAHDQMLRFVR